ncbi:hypothetical protein [Mangrovimonas sp. YM274]|uniref:hypothetical protein n=1 Tax=Mangrovimonas sp. YM274 TaxID=3070660 RepID=UPI0027DD99C1|nr:hypothetical protein [Mangrovimonas sp. YM274]WMI69156.1 hypothetical protein RBH95_02005 [Mangrovimonas sp. YM274]
MKTKFALLLAISLFFNCSTDDGDSSATSNCETDIPFLQEGNSWTYQMTVFGFENGEASMTVGQCNGAGYEVERVVPNLSTGQLETGTDLWMQDGDYLINEVGNGSGTLAEIYKKNVSVGDVWTYTRGDGHTVTHEVVAVDSLITVPAGTFSCNVFKHTTTSAFNETFVCWNDDFGNIKEDGMGWFNLELINYQVN